MEIAIHDAIAAFKEAMMDGGVNPPPDITADGELHRFATNGRASDDAGFYVLHCDGVPAGLFGCWREGIESTWRFDLGRKLNRDESAAHAGGDQGDAPIQASRLGRIETTPLARVRMQDRPVEEHRVE